MTDLSAGEAVSKIACAEIQVVNGFYVLSQGHPRFLYMMRLEISKYQVPFTLAELIARGDGLTST